MTLILTLLGYMAYHHVSLIDLCLHTKFRWNWKNFLWADRRTYIRTDRLDWNEQCFTSPSTQCRLYGRRFLQVKRFNQQYQSTEGRNSTQTNQTYNKQTWTQNTASPLVYTNIGWLGDDSSHSRQRCQAWTAVGLPPWYPGDGHWDQLY